MWLKNAKKGQQTPPSKDNVKLKEYMRAVYEQKRFYENEEEEKEKEKAKKAKKKSKKTKKEESEEEDETHEKDSEKVKEETKAKEHSSKHKAPKELPKEPPKEKKHSVTPSEKKPSAPLIDILDFGAPSTEPKDILSGNVAPAWASFSLPKGPVEEKKVQPPSPVQIPAPAPAKSPMVAPVAIPPPAAPKTVPTSLPSPFPPMPVSIFFSVAEKTKKFMIDTRSTSAGLHGYSSICRQCTLLAILRPKNVVLPTIWNYSSTICKCGE